jgi:Lipocalin-like domain
LLRLRVPSIHAQAEGDMTRLKLLALAPVLLAATAASFAADRDVLLGSWRLVSFEREYQATGEREYPMGKSPTGHLHFLPSGSMAVVITAEGRKAATTDQERAGLFNSMVAYTGSYRVDGDKWITKVDVSWLPPWVGTEQIRSFRVTGDQLQEMTAWASRPDNRMARAVITYERVK